MAPDPRAEPVFFVDRSLGKSIVIGLRAVGLDARSMTEVYGERAGQGLEDETWLRDAGLNDWVVLTKDNAIRRRPAEREALTEARARVFCLTTSQLRGAEQLERFVNNRDRIVRIARLPGPYIYGVYEDRVIQIWPKKSP